MKKKFLKVLYLIKNETFKEIFRIMRICFILLFVFSFQLMALNTKAQDAVIELNNNSLTLGQLINEIERQTDYLVVYSNREIDTNQEINLPNKSDKVSTYLNEAFKRTDIAYEFENNYIVLLKRSNQNASTVANLIQAAQQSQQKEISGKITDSSGDPIPGATVMVKGTTIGTITDADGKFFLRIPANAQTLQISFIGMKNQEIPIGERTTFNIQLEEETVALEEVVAIGYGVQKKVNLTGAVASVRSDDILKAQSANTANTLVGQIPGLIAKQPTGEPGNDNSQLFIRGVATFRGSTAPTFIIDGIERTYEDFARLDPHEIESLSVLKDAASAAVFGMRGANGVILVTTKRGRPQKIQASYSGNISTQSPTKLPSFANSADYARMKNIYMNKEIYTPEEIEKFANGSDPENYPNTNWYKETLTKNAIQQQHNITLNGGREDIAYFTSFGYLNQGGLWNNLNYDRYSLRANIDANITKSTKLSVDISGRVEHTHSSPTNSTGVFQQLVRNTPILLAKNKDGLLIVPDATHPNIIALISKEAGYNNSRNNTVTPLIELEQNLSFITDGLKIKGVFSYEKNNYAQKLWSKSPSLYVRDPLNKDNYIPQPHGSPNLYENTYDNEYIEWQGHVSYNKSFKNHSFSVLAMGLGQKENYHNLWVQRNSFDSEVMDQINAGNTQGQQLGGYDEEHARVSFVGRINYSYANKYLFEVNSRRDASENFSPEKRWGTFSSVSGGWVMSEENFFEDLRKEINFLKFRVSYGTLGNDNTGGIAFPYYSRFDLYFPNGAHAGGLPNDLGDYIFGNLVTKGLQPGPIANPLAAWETSKKTNVGMDWGLFNIINLSLDVFKENRFDILAQRGSEVPWSFGGILPLENIGKVVNKGIELLLSFNQKIGQFHYNLGGNFTYARNKVLEMAEAAGTTKYMKHTGRPIYSYYGYKTDGIFQSQAEIDAYAKQEVAGIDYVTKPGDIKYVDVDGNGVVNAGDMTYLGYGNVPEIVYGINGSISYKNFDFSFLFQGTGHVQVYLNGGVIMPYYNDGNLPSLWIKNAWTEEKPNSRYPRLEASNHNFPNTEFPPVQTYLYDASYLRLKNIEIGYNFNYKWLVNNHIENIRIYLSGQNLLTFTKVPQIDPENLHSQGWSYPQMKSFNGGITIQF